MYILCSYNKVEKQIFSACLNHFDHHHTPSGRPLCDYLSQLVVAEVQVDQRVELGEARQLVQLIAGQAQGLDVAQTGVSSFQDPQAVIGQIHVDQIVQVLQPHDSYFSTAVNDKHICRGV